MGPGPPMTSLFVPTGSHNAQPLEASGRTLRNKVISLSVTGHGQDGVDPRYRAHLRKGNRSILRRSAAQSTSFWSNAAGARAPLPQRRIDRGECFRPWAKFALRQLVERRVGGAENLVQFVRFVLDINESGGDLAGDTGALQRGKCR